LLFAEQSHRALRVSLAPGSAPGELLAYLSGRTVPIVVNGRRTGRAAADTGTDAVGEQKVIAPMPGRVVRVLVEMGDEVEARQPVVVVEAMKMENELRSPKAGRVKDVAVSAGASVEAGRVLVIVE
jgi:biotin carboxyl carrier protein